MRRMIPTLVAGVLAAAFLFRAPTAAPLTAKHPPAAQQAQAAGEPAGAAKGAYPTLRFDPETQVRLGLQSAPVVEARLQPEVRAYGRVEDPIQLVSLIYDHAAAKAALDASETDYRRVSGLYESGRNASARDLAAARAALGRDRAAFEAAEVKLIAAAGRSLAVRGGLRDRARALTAGEAALVRVDVPAGEAPAAPPVGGTLLALGEDDQPLEANFLGPAASTDPALQGRSYLFWVRRKPPPPGTAVFGRLRTGGAGKRGVAVPSSALVRDDGRTFVYVKLGAGAFTRRLVTLGPIVAGGRFVSGNIAPGDRVVVTGAQQLLSSEILPKPEGGE